MLPHDHVEPAGVAADPASGDDPDLLQPGDVVGRYRITKCIGEGGVGVVYAAEDPGLARVVAIKVLRAAQGRRAEAQQRRMLREAQALARVSHRNLVMVFDVGMHDGRVWIAMEYVEGDTLDEWLERERRTWREIVEAFISAGRGLAAVHAAGLVHRDFKPANVLVRPDGTVQVLDFGLATRVGEAIEVTEQEASESLASMGRDALLATATKSIHGTPAYMAPEQFLLQAIDGRTDQFGFCVALYEALYARRPFEGEDVPDVLHAILDGLPGLPPELPGLPEVVRRALARGLSVAKEDRYPDMNALLEALESTRVAPQRRSGGWVRFALGMLVGGGVLAAGMVWATRDEEPVVPPPVVAPPQPAVREASVPVQTPTPAPTLRELPSVEDPEPAAEPEIAPQREAGARVREREPDELPKIPTPASGTKEPTRLPSISELDDVEPAPAEPTPAAKPSAEDRGAEAPKEPTAAPGEPAPPP